MSEHLWMTVEDVLRIVDANTTRQEIERALIANLPHNGGPSSAVESEPSQIRELIEDLCSAAVSYGERDTKDAENAYYAAKAILIGATRAASPAVVSEPASPSEPKVHCHVCPAKPEDYCERNCLDVIKEQS